MQSLLEDIVLPDDFDCKGYDCDTDKNYKKYELVVNIHEPKIGEVQYHRGKITLNTLTQDRCILRLYKEGEETIDRSIQLSIRQSINKIYNKYPSNDHLHIKPRYPGIKIGSLFSGKDAFKPIDIKPIKFKLNDYYNGEGSEELNNDDEFDIEDYNDLMDCDELNEHLKVYDEGDIF